MPTINFYLKSHSTRKGLHSVILTYQHRGSKVNLSTKVKVTRQVWDIRRQRVKPQAMNSMQLNALLERAHQKMQEVQLSLQLQGVDPTVEHVREAMKPIETPTIAFERIETDFLQRQMSMGTRDRFKRLFYFLKQYAGEQKDTGKAELSVAGITPKFFEAFGQYLMERSGMIDNSITKYQQSLKTFLFWCAKRGYLERFEPHQYTSGKLYRTAHVALTEDELNALETLHLETETEQAFVRDVFLFSCYTGLRYSDLAQLRPEHIKKSQLAGETHHTLEFTIMKTRERLIVPLTAKALALLEAYNYRLPVRDPRSTNDRLKTLCKLAKLEAPIQKISYRNGKRIAETHPKYKLISMHTARRTFATLSWVKGVSLVTIQRVLGHAKVEQTMTYIKEIEGQTSKEVLAAWDKPKTTA